MKVRSQPAGPNHVWLELEFKRMAHSVPLSRFTLSARRG
jgi:hypothetical protein